MGLFKKYSPDSLIDLKPVVVVESESCRLKDLMKTADYRSHMEMMGILGNKEAEIAFKQGF